MAACVHPSYALLVVAYALEKSWKGITSPSDIGLLPQGSAWYTHSSQSIPVGRNVSCVPDNASHQGMLSVYRTQPFQTKKETITTEADGTRRDVYHMQQEGPSQPCTAYQEQKRHKPMLLKLFSSGMRTTSLGISEFLQHDSKQSAQPR